MSPSSIFFLKVTMYLLTWIIAFRLRDKSQSKYDIAFAAVVMLLVYYGMYVFSFIEYINVRTVLGHAVFFVFLISFYIVFKLGLGKSHQSITERPSLQLSKPYGFYVAWVFIIFFVYIFVLTKGNLLQVLQIAVELKYLRRDLISQEQSYSLEVLQSVAVSQVIVLAIWSSLTLSQSRLGFWISLILSVLEVMSTGSRSPAVAFIFLYFSALYFASDFDSRAAIYFKNFKKYAIYFAFLLAAYMVLTTASRSEAEALSIDVFTYYFGVESYGPFEFLFESNDNPFIFFIATLVIYVSSTIINFMIIFQLYDWSFFSFGYQVFYPYYSVLGKLTGVDFGYLSDIARDSRTKFYLEYSESATQWSTLFGDFLLSMGPVYGLVMVCVFSYVLGRVARRAFLSPSLPATGLIIYTHSFFLMPLVAPTGSMTFHCVVLTFVGFQMLGLGKNRVQFQRLSQS